MTAAAASTDALRRGACPSIAAPMRTGDGLLVRLRPVAATLSARDLAALAGLARSHGNGLIEITARGNLQLRGLSETTVPHLAEDLRAAGIVPQTGVAVEIPPLAGVDPSETADATPLAEALRRELSAAGLSLAPKLSVVVDGGGVLSLADMVADIRLDAVSTAGRVLWRLSVGGDRATARPVALLPPDEAAGGVMAIAAALAAHGPAARGRDLDISALRCTPVPALPAAAFVHPLGVYRIGEETVLGVAPAYGQMQAERLAALADGLSACGAKAFRLAPHRTLLVCGLSGERLARARAAADREGFWHRKDAPGRTVSICAGAAGCASGMFDTRAAADVLAGEAGALLDGSVAVHISGCPKGCAHPAAAALTFCGTAAGVSLVLDGRAGDAPAATLPATDLTPAIHRLAALLRARRLDGEPAKAILHRIPPAELVSAYQGRS